MTEGQLVELTWNGLQTALAQAEEQVWKIRSTIDRMIATGNFVVHCHHDGCQATAVVRNWSRLPGWVCPDGQLVDDGDINHVFCEEHAGDAESDLT